MGRWTSFLDFTGLLTERDVRFLVVGGYAVAVHGHRRYTGDFDLWLLVEPGNAASVIDALDVFGFPDLELTAEDLQVPGRFVQIGRPPLRIDLLTSVDGVRFEDCWPRRLDAVEFMRTLSGRGQGEGLLARTILF